MIRYTTSVSGVLRTVNFFVEQHQSGAEVIPKQVLTYSYGPRNLPYHDPDQDQWEYRLPNGKKYTHPTKEGCLLMILKHFFEKGITNAQE